MSPLSLPHGFINGEWQKQPIVFGITDELAGKVVNTSLNAGNNNIDGDVIPAGEIWVITNLAMIYIGTVANVEIYARLGGTPDSIFWGVKPPVSGVTYDRQGQWIAMEGNKLRMQVLGATLNDDAYFYYSGYKIGVSF